MYTWLSSDDEFLKHSLRKLDRIHQTYPIMTNLLTFTNNRQFYHHLIFQKLNILLTLIQLILCLQIIVLFRNLLSPPLSFNTPLLLNNPYNTYILGDGRVLWPMFLLPYKKQNISY